MPARSAHRRVCSKCARAANCAHRDKADPLRSSCEHFTPYTGHRDLCCTCDHARACSSVGTAERPVFFCEEFIAAGHDRRVRTGAFARLNRPAPLGLCGDCDYRDTCQAARPEGGVWHCEEYR
jgi:hypothetical protein